MNDPPGMPEKDECIGIILVHGIGEQRRFEHLDGQLRFLIRALHGLKLDPANPVFEVSVDIRPSAAAAFHAEADSWSAGPQPAVTIVVHSEVNGQIKKTYLQVHEVWWADVNEPYSLAKQFRFWLWGLAVWARAGKAASRFATKTAVAPAVAAKVDATPPTLPWHHTVWDRARLFMVGVYFTLLGYSIGTLSFLGNRLLNLRTPKILQLLTNYVSGVKIYNQRHRYGSGLGWQWEEFLDSVGDPPRVSIRRRMIRTIADVACNGYDRWYILAHSLGTVVAFNGLMETAYAWPGYLDQRRWNRLARHGFTGLLGGPPSTDATLPRRPAWLGEFDIANRQRIFERCEGILTYGSPLEKFAAIWPALVALSLEPGVFADDLKWLNVYDPLDPVSGRLAAFIPPVAGACPFVQNLGYCAGWVLLLAHSQYLKRRQDGKDLATAVVRWLLTDNIAVFGDLPSGVHLGDQFAPVGTSGRGWRHWFRSAIAWIWWLGTAAALLLLGAIVLPILFSAAGAAISGIWDSVARLDYLSGQNDPPAWVRCVGKFFANLLACCTTQSNRSEDWITALIDHLPDWLSLAVGKWPPLVDKLVLLALFALVLPLVIGAGAWLMVFRRDDDDTAKQPLDHDEAERRRHGI
jgi:hypothetical protein